MSGLLRPTPTHQVLDLTRRLAEEYAGLPLADVARIVHASADAAVGRAESPRSWAPRRVRTTLATIEQLAREDLDRARAERGRLRRGPAAAAPRAAPRRAPRRGVGSLGSGRRTDPADLTRR